MSRLRRAFTVFAALAFASAGIAAVETRGARPAAAVGEVHSDFNGDGYDDLAALAASEDVGSLPDAGVVTVMYGSATGLHGAGSVQLTEDSPGIPGKASAYDYFGETDAVGDFNKDGYDDLAIGEAKSTSVVGAGAVVVLFGASGGLNTGKPGEYFTAATAGGTDMSLAFFGAALGAGDFDGDGYDDLAIGQPSAPVGAVRGAGRVTVLRGGAHGLTPSGTWIDENTPGIVGVPQANGGFGDVMLVDRFDTDRYADLAIGEPEVSVGAKHDGAVHIVFGSASGLSHRAVRDTSRRGVVNAYYGLTLASTHSPAGGSTLYAYGPDGTTHWRGIVESLQYGGGVLHAALFATGVYDHGQLGLGMAVGRMGANGSWVALGAPGIDELGTPNFAGRVEIHSASTKATLATYTQDTPGVPDTNEPDDDFGWTLEARDFNGDGYDDLVVSTPYEDIGSVQDAGSFYVFYGSANGPVVNGVKRFQQGQFGVPGSPQKDAAWGYS